MRHYIGMVLPLGRYNGWAPSHLCEWCSGDNLGMSVNVVVGETDSFGSEYSSVCQKCLDNYLESDSFNSSPSRQQLLAEEYGLDEDELDYEDED